MSDSIEEGVHFLSVRVYYEDTDFSGFVYHASYLRFAERGRTEFLRACGVAHAELLKRKTPLVFALKHMEMAFLAPARIDDALDVRTAFVSIKGARIDVRQEIRRTGETLWRASCEIACLNAATAHPTRLPDDIKEKLGKSIATK